MSFASRQSGAICAVLLSLVTPGWGKETWRYARTPHFEVYSAASPRETESIIGDVELFNLALSTVVGSHPRSIAPMRIVLFDREEDFDPYKPELPEKQASAMLQRYEDRLKWLSQGFGRRGMPRFGSDIRLAMGMHRGWHESEVRAGLELGELRRRYGVVPEVHYELNDEAGFVVLSGEREWDDTMRVLCAVQTRRTLRAMRLSAPLWWEDGMVAVMSDFFIGRNECSVGGSGGGRSSFLLMLGALMPWEDFFSVRADDELWEVAGVRWAFSAQAWLLMQYAYFSEERAADWRSAIMQLMLAQRNGQPIDDAQLRAVLGVDGEGLTAELASYLKRQRFNQQFFEYPETWDGRHLTLRKMSVETVAELMREVKLRITLDAGEAAQVETLAAEGKASISELAALGAYEVEHGSPAAAAAWWQRAAAAGSGQAAHWRAVAEHEVERRWEAADLRVWPDEDVVAAWREQLSQALSGSPPGDERTWEVLAWVEALAAKPEVAQINRLQREVPNMTDPDLTLLALAWVRARMGDRSTAAAVLAPMLEHPQHRWHRLAQGMVAGLERLE